MAGSDMMQLTAQPERWVNLTGSDGKVKARLNVTTGELVIRDRGIFHRWALRLLLECEAVQQRGEGLNPP